MTTRHYSATAQPTTLTADATDSATTITVAATTGFPAHDFTLAIGYGTGSQEVVLVTDVVGLTLTVTRGYDSTPAVAHSTGAAVQHVHSAVDFRDIATHIDATSGVHGTSGAVVDTTSSQSLTHKNLTDATNLFPSSLATDVEVSSAVSAHAALTATHGATGAVVGTTNAQTLTNKNLTDGTNTFPPSLATDSEVATALATATSYTDTHSAATAAHGATGAVVGTTNTQTLTNKTLTSPTINAPTITSPTITGVGQIVRARVDSTDFFASSTTLSASPDLGVSLPSAGSWEVDIYLFIGSDANAAGDVKVGLSGPANTDFYIGGHGLTSSLASGSLGEIEAKAISALGASSIGPLSYGASTSMAMVHVHGIIDNTATGTLRLLRSQVASSATQSWINTGSQLIARRIA